MAVENWPVSWFFCNLLGRQDKRSRGALICGCEEVKRYGFKRYGADKLAKCVY